MNISVTESTWTWEVYRNKMVRRQTHTNGIQLPTSGSQWGSVWWSGCTGGKHSLLCRGG